MTQVLPGAVVVGSGEWDRFSKAVDEVMKEFGRRRFAHGEIPSGRVGLQVLMHEMQGVMYMMQTGRRREVFREAAVGLAAAAIGTVMALCGEGEPGAGVQGSGYGGTTTETAGAAGPSTGLGVNETPALPTKGTEETER